ncbi:amino acid aminotransferase [Glaciimonas soli]|uniref:Aminotransferase class I/II-fold pyridoxal phosphate-dependent enzyme n=1 Tax=Glaciimonas soli TaxID=2590999 RepID=A0A843YNG9_9BURK|nr:amino acid aminotransferase [Glaciimonas soli]MQR00510.1 aminotransferase class I/II-fold pyridoxal phosphate-dependent enzyme [Glaciimonas soli]
MFEHVDHYPGDPILSLLEKFGHDTRPNKVNLSIGLYYDENGKIPVLKSVQAAAKIVQEKAEPHTYLPMEGLAAYREAVQHLLFGRDSAALRDNRVATIQSVGGSGALRVAADFIKTYLPDSAVWISDPSWDNHHALFTAARIQVHTYPYYDAVTNNINFGGMLETLNTLPAKSIVLMQPCCHNPTGLDLNHAQWKEVIGVLQQRNLIPFLDIAYQGFGDGIEEDAWVVRAMADAGLTMVVTNSFSKNFSLYGERCGGLSFVCPSAKEAALVLGQLKAGVRRIYSSPPLFGSKLVATVLHDADLRQQWDREVAAMRDRIKTMREKLRNSLTAHAPSVDGSYLVNQRGMFSYTGFTAAEVDSLREDSAIYLIRSGRLCIPGLNNQNVESVAQAMAETLKKRA